MGQVRARVDPARAGRLAVRGLHAEAVPASAAYLAFAALAAKFIPFFLLFPVMMVALPLSGIAGLLYAVQYNRTGGRQRLFGDKDTKQLPSG